MSKVERFPYTPINFSLESKKGRQHWLKIPNFPISNLAQAKQFKQQEAEKIFGSQPELNVEAWPLFPKLLTPVQMQSIKQEFVAQMNAGLQQQESSLAMINARFNQEIMSQEIELGSQVLVVDAGGTSLKLMIYEQTENGLQATQACSQPIEMAFPITKWLKETGAKDYFDFIATQIKQKFPDLGGIKAIALIFSFPAQALATQRGVDVLVNDDSLTKEWVIKGLAKGGTVGEQFSSSLQKQFLLSEAGPVLAKLPIAVMNDTVAVVGEEIGAINATGMNVAALIDGLIYNLEAGGFDSPVLKKSLLMNIFDEESEKPGTQQTEKVISGYAVEGLFRTFVEKAVLHHLLPENFIHHLADSKLPLVINQILMTTEDANKWAEVETWFGSSLTDHQRHLLKQICERITDNSAAYFASLLLAVVERVDQDLHRGRYEIPIEGSFFWLMPKYCQKVQEKLKELNTQGIEISFLGGPKQRVSLEGAGVKALKVASYLKNQPA